MSKFFTVEVKPIIPAGKQAAEVFGGDGVNDLLFDWTPFQVPKGAHKLTSIAVAFRGSDGNVQTAFAFDLHFARTINNVAPPSMGVINGTMSAVPALTNHMIGMCGLDVGDFGTNGWDLIGAAQTGGGSASNNTPNLVLQGEPDSGDNVGYDTLYIGGEMGPDDTTDDFGFDFRSTCETNNAGGAQGTGQPELVVSTKNALKVFAPGDTVHDEDDRLMGVVKTVASSKLVFEDNLANASVNDKDLYNINPIKITLSFEK